jgi:DNA replication initiation complex subunit (GINS family)
MILSHNSLENYFRTNFAMMQHHKYSLSEIENLMPWEREIYLSLLQQFIREENERIKNQNREQNR